MKMKKKRTEWMTPNEKKARQKAEVARVKALRQRKKFHKNNKHLQSQTLLLLVNLHNQTHSKHDRVLAKF